MSGRAPADQDVRTRLRTEFETTFFVEAGAGTGKTSEIVLRIVGLTAAGRLAICGLAAITFTVAAAAELRARIREGLAVAAGAEDRSAAERERCERAAQAIDEASIDTIHAFAGALLRTYPLEAGLPPGFEMLNEIEQDLEFEERFRAWFAVVDRDPAVSGLIRGAFLLGLRPADIRTLAHGLHEHYDLLRPPAPAAPATPVDLIAASVRLGARLAELQALLRPEMASEPAAAAVEEQRFAGERLRAARTDDDAIRALRAAEDLRTTGRGDKKVWETTFGPGAGAVLSQLRDGLKEVKRDAHAMLARRRQPMFAALQAALTLEVLRWSAERRRRGVATFQDLLTWARDLLRSNAEVRGRVQRRWTHLFIDEFQDTDPLQAELAFYLAADPGADPNADWRDVPLVPGKLCVVGDPKQSIYRFRRADIGLYERVRESVVGGGGAVVPLTQNFRSVPRVLEFVNTHYATAMVETPKVQPAYTPLSAEPDDTGVGVRCFGEALDASQPEVWQAEADAVARSARAVVDGGWLVSDRADGARVSRPARYRDLCVLIPSRTNLRRLERAFEREGVVYRIESGELIVATQEVRDVVSCLRAIDDPSDQVALVATLRSPLYGCSDEELLAWADGRGPLTYEYVPDVAPIGLVRDALGGLARLHAGRNERSVAALIEQLLAERMLVPAAFGQGRPREVWRRYRYLVDRARAFAETGRTSLRAFVDWIEGIEREQVRDVSPAVAEDDEDAVRVLTVHGAKGLEFPVVILTGWGSRLTRPLAPVLADRATDRLEIGLGTGDERPWSTSGWLDAAKREKSAVKAENVRLSYVAATRARDHLIVSVCRKKKGADPQGEALAATAASLDIQPMELTPSAVAPVVESPPDPRTPEEHAAAERAWLDGREAVIEARSGLVLQTATGLAHELAAGPEHPADAVPPRRGRGGTSLGRAVHAVLQTIDLLTLAGLEVHARAQAEAEGIPARAVEVARLVRAAATLAPVREAATRGRFWREVPVGGPIEGGILEGVVDLLYEDEHGDLVVLDYKTDDLARTELDGRLERYRPQGEAYATLVERATGRRVSSVVFAFARLGEWRALTRPDGARAKPPNGSGA